MLIRKLLRTAWSYKSQFISMIIMIAIGVGIFLGFNIEWQSIETDTSDFFEKTKYADFRIYSDAGFSEDDIAAIQGINGVDAATRYLSVNVGIKDTMENYLDMLDNDISSYVTKVNLSESATNEDALALVQTLDGDWQAAQGISYNGKTVSLEIYNSDCEKLHFLSEDNERLKLSDDGVYLCLRLKDTADIGDTIVFSPYGSKESYEVKVAGYFRSLITESIVMTDAYADSIGMDYRISSVYTDVDSDDIESSPIIVGKQDKATLMDSYDTFMDIMNTMIVVLVVAAIVLGVVVLYNLGVMSYVERYRELATLKVLGFRDKTIGRLLISQNIWLTVIGVLIGLPGGVGILKVLVVSLASEYELSITLGVLTYSVSILLTFGVSLLVGFMVARKNKKIDMVEALKGAE